MAEQGKLAGNVATAFSMGWKIWGVVLITELFYFCFRTDRGLWKTALRMAVHCAAERIAAVASFCVPPADRQTEACIQQAGDGGMCCIPADFLCGCDGVGAYERDADANGSVTADAADAALQRPGHDACTGGAADCGLCAGLCLFYTCQFLFPADNAVY